MDRRFCCGGGFHMQPNPLRLDGIAHAYGPNRVLKGINLTLGADEGVEDLYVGGNNPQSGVVAAEYLKSKLADGGKIVVMRGIPTAIDTIRIEAFQKTLESSGIEILDMQYANWNPDKAFEVMRDYLTRFPKIDGVWAGDDDAALGGPCSDRTGRARGGYGAAGRFGHEPGDQDDHGRRQADRRQYLLSADPDRPGHRDHRDALCHAVADPRPPCPGQPADHQSQCRGVLFPRQPLLSAMGGRERTRPGSCPTPARPSSLAQNRQSRLSVALRGAP
ncbi:hypothetical protein E3U25_05670 (plasmid) [Paracoccus versutus]|nr:hypothetical protein E3U25_05670 [Paracoccus versutus]